MPRKKPSGRAKYRAPSCRDVVEGGAPSVAARLTASASCDVEDVIVEGTAERLFLCLEHDEQWRRLRAALAASAHLVQDTRYDIYAGGQSPATTTTAAATAASASDAVTSVTSVTAVTAAMTAMGRVADRVALLHLLAHRAPQWQRMAVISNDNFSRRGRWTWTSAWDPAAPVGDFPGVRCHAEDGRVVALSVSNLIAPFGALRDTGSGAAGGAAGGDAGGAAGHAAGHAVVAKYNAIDGTGDASTSDATSDASGHTTTLRQTIDAGRTTSSGGVTFSNEHPYNTRHEPYVYGIGGIGGTGGTALNCVFLSALTELRLTGRAGNRSHGHTMRWRGWREKGYGGARGRWDGTAEACGELGALLSVSPCLEILVASKYFTLDAETSQWRTTNDLSQVCDAIILRSCTPFIYLLCLI